jgi:hypothetical protein
MVAVVIAALLVTILSRFQVEAAEARARIRELDPTNRLLHQAFTEGICLATPRFDSIAYEAIDDFEALFTPLPEQHAQASSYRLACNYLIHKNPNLAGDDLRVVLTTAMRHKDSNLFRTALNLAGENAGIVTEDEDALEYFVYELMSPFVPPTFLDDLLNVIGCQNDRLISTIHFRLNPIIVKHREVFERHCGPAEQSTGELFQRSVKAFKRIEFNAEGGEQSVDSMIFRKDLPNFEIIYSITNRGNVQLRFHDAMQVADIFDVFEALLNVEEPPRLTVFVHQKDSDHGFIMKTAGHEGPLFLVLKCDDEEECEPISEMTSLVNSSTRSMVIKFDIRPNRFFLGFPANFVAAYNNELFTHASGWFSDMPKGTQEVSTAFKASLDHHNIQVHTEVVFAPLGNLLPLPLTAFQSDFYRMDSSKGKEPEADSVVDDFTYGNNEDSLNDSVLFEEFEEESSGTSFADVLKSLICLPSLFE